MGRIQFTVQACRVHLTIVGSVTCSKMEQLQAWAFGRLNDCNTFAPLSTLTFVWITLPFAAFDLLQGLVRQLLHC